MTDWKLVCEVGFKILTATVAGIVVFVGIGKSLNGNKPQEVNKNTEGQSFPGTSAEQQQTEIKKKEEPQILKSAKAILNTYGKLFAFIQSFTLIVENLTKIFGGSNTNTNQTYYGGDPWAFRQPVNSGNGQTWTRISPFIIEAGPVNTGYHSMY